MRRDGSRNAYFTQRIPADIRDRAVGLRLAIPIGDSFAFVQPSGGAQSIRCSLRTDDPSEAKKRQPRHRERRGDLPKIVVSYGRQLPGFRPEHLAQAVEH